VARHQVEVIDRIRKRDESTAGGTAVDSLDDRSGGVVRASSQPVSALSLPGSDWHGNDGAEPVPTQCLRALPLRVSRTESGIRSTRNSRVCSAGVRRTRAEFPRCRASPDRCSDVLIVGARRDGGAERPLVAHRHFVTPLAEYPDVLGLYGLIALLARGLDAGGTCGIYAAGT
jgi:hypothetical protein